MDREDPWDAYYCLGIDNHSHSQGQLSLFWQRSTVLVVGAFLHSLQMLAASMGMRWDKILEFQVWVTELYKMVSTFIMLIRID